MAAAGILGSKAQHGFAHSTPVVPCRPPRRFCMPMPSWSAAPGPGCGPEVTARGEGWGGGRDGCFSGAQQGPEPAPSPPQSSRPAHLSNGRARTRLGVSKANPVHEFNRPFFGKRARCAPPPPATPAPLIRLAPAHPATVLPAHRLGGVGIGRGSRGCAPVVTVWPEFGAPPQIGQCSGVHWQLNRWMSGQKCSEGF